MFVFVLSRPRITIHRRPNVSLLLLLLLQSLLHTFKSIWCCTHTMEKKKKKKRWFLFLSLGCIRQHTFSILRYDTPDFSARCLYPTSACFSGLIILLPCFFSSLFSFLEITGSRSMHISSHIIFKRFLSAPRVSALLVSTVDGFCPDGRENTSTDSLQRLFVLFSGVYLPSPSLLNLLTGSVSLLFFLIPPYSPSCSLSSLAQPANVRPTMRTVPVERQQQGQRERIRRRHTKKVLDSMASSSCRLGKKKTGFFPPPPPHSTHLLVAPTIFSAYFFRCDDAI